MSEKAEKIHPWRWRALTVWIIIFTIAVGFSIHQGREGQQANRERIQDIQVSRVLSCKATFEGIRQVLKPFFPAKGHRTAKQVRNLRKFNAIIDKRKRKCVVQVHPTK